MSRPARSAGFLRHAILWIYIDTQFYVSIDVYVHAYGIGLNAQSTMTVISGGWKSQTRDIVYTLYRSAKV